MIILADSGTFRFYWEDERRTVPGILSTSGGLAAGMGVSRSANPNVSGWIQLIDDIRFGRMVRPANAKPTPPPTPKQPPPPAQPVPIIPAEQITESQVNKRLWFTIAVILSWNYYDASWYIDIMWRLKGISNRP